MTDVPLVGIQETVYGLPRPDSYAVALLCTRAVIYFGSPPANLSAR